MKHARTRTGLYPPTDFRPFDDLLGITEDAFVVAGNCLEDSVTEIRALQTVFAELETSIGPEADSALNCKISEIADQGHAMQTGFDQIATATTGLRGAMTGVRKEVRSLGTTVRMIANISINARIQGNSLSQPKPQIRSFVDRLGHLSTEAETILSDVNGAMAAVGDAVKDIELAQIAMSDELRQRTFPAIEDFTAVARAISAEQPALRDSSTVIANQMQLVSTDVARIVTSLQIGDTLRQRLEQIHAALALAGQNPNEVALSYRIAAAQAEGTLHDSLPHIDEALMSLDAVARRGRDIAGAATASAFATDAARRADAGERSLTSFRSSLAACRAHFATIQTAADRVQTQIEIILGHDATLQGIAQQVRMAGINAVIACAKVGEDGRALRELAQWLRVVTDEYSDTMQRLQVALGASRTSLEGIGDDMIAHLETDLSAFLLEASDLGSMIAKANRTLAAVSVRFDTVAQALAGRIQTSTSALSAVRSRLTDIPSASGMLRFFASIHPEPDISTEDAISYLTTIRRKYTMASERSLHDQLIASLDKGTDAPIAPIPATAAEQIPHAIETEDLEDIFF